MTSGAYIAAMGIISALGTGTDSTYQALKGGKSGLASVDFFQLNRPNFPKVGMVPGTIKNTLPRTHALARIAAGQIMAQCSRVPDAVVLGATTGGMLTCESLLKAKETDPKRFRYHGLGTVAEDLADLMGCTGPAITVSTACSSGNAALTIALEMIRSGQAETVLAGGADALCRMTCFGFQSLQVVDPAGARPFDQKRSGMSVAEGAGLLLLVSQRPENPVAELSGGGLSCDAYHASSPHPEGNGAFDAMAKAMDDAGVTPEQIDYISLHGTGTQANDRAEAMAVNRLFNPDKPAASSVKGATGHSMAAAGAIEAIISAIAVSKGIIPGNTGFSTPDPELNFIPVHRPIQQPVHRVLSNTFGFGGNNAAIVISKTENQTSGTCAREAKRVQKPQMGPMSVLGYACVTGAGTTAESLGAFYKGQSLAGMIADKTLTDLLTLKKVRRMKRFSRLMLALAVLAGKETPPDISPASIIGGTGWGSLSETWDFLSRLFAGNEKSSSPIDFVGSVHNAALGHVAMELGAKGANITTTGGDASFEQALWTAGILGKKDHTHMMVMGGDEHHPDLSFRFDMSVVPEGTAADGGGALVLAPGAVPGNPTLTPRLFMKNDDRLEPKETLADLTRELPDFNDRYGAVMAGIPKALNARGKALADALPNAFSSSIPILDYRRLTGQFATAPAVAAVLAVDAVKNNRLPDPNFPGQCVDLQGRGILLLGLGRHLTAVEVMPG
ncbi:3-oxoacyl-ACP synthase [Desulfobacter hydrogenophilus]|uniref:3-oxoacyl-ACP synthase n=1 Tax=Desulfobacter hydrogenophilus TaxID=2291 RepID=A0A328FAN8_9BACT|nr:beta-ketoacyl-[acyl-carrier-protein] synthase family protein [Desulfobacter hydrogenophilus]NDY72604.1 3-oxoacyl-ACP synthase [Desulfobacter hydrogenophilus]QBH13324.1 3-oxoacyl-ACP synthase [Desulfobacter hydrogenophilus]RAM01276.1 3-oxoacyl-ACP synthase [Desulfobacter hydrogenophilus]